MMGAAGYAAACVRELLRSSVCGARLVRAHLAFEMSHLRSPGVFTEVNLCGHAYYADKLPKQAHFLGILRTHVRIIIHRAMDPCETLGYQVFETRCYQIRIS